MHSAEFQAGRSTSWGAHTRPRGPGAVLGDSYNQTHSPPAPHSLLAPHSFDHTLGHTPGTPGRWDTGQLDAETQRHRQVRGMTATALPTLLEFTTRRPLRDGKPATCSGQRASLGSLWAIPGRGWLAEQTHGTVSGTSRETGHPPGHSDEQRQQAQGTGSPCQEHSHTQPPSSAGGTAPCRPALGIPEGGAEEKIGLAPPPQIPLSPPAPLANSLCLVPLATAGSWALLRAQEEGRAGADPILHA